MKLSELSELARRETGEEDPELRLATDLGFVDIIEVLSREHYRDESATGNELEKGNFAVVEASLCTN